MGLADWFWSAVWRARVSWRVSQRRRLRRRLRAQYRAASRLELQWRLYEAERMTGHYMRAWVAERDRTAQQIAILQAQVARRDEVIRSIRIGLQSVAAGEAASGFGGLDAQEMPPRNPHELEAENPAHIPTAAR